MPDFLLIGTVCGYVALGVQCVIYVSTKRSRIIFLKLLNDIASFFNYLFLGLITGAVLSVVGMGRECVFLARDKYKWADRIFWLFFFAALMMISPILEWRTAGHFTLQPLLPAVGSIILVVGLYNRLVLLTKICCGVGEGMWLTYNLLGGENGINYIAAVSCGVGVLSALIGIARELILIRKNRKNKTTGVL